MVSPDRSCPIPVFVQFLGSSHLPFIGYAALLPMTAVRMGFQRKSCACARHMYKTPRAIYRQYTTLVQLLSRQLAINQQNLAGFAGHTGAGGDDACDPRCGDMHERF